MLVDHGLTERDVERAKVVIWEQLCKGKTDIEIMKSMGLPRKMFLALKHSTLEDKAQEYKQKPSEHVYVEYVIKQQENINDLTEMIKEFKDAGQYNAFVGAIKARADLYDRLITKGQEFGVYQKAPDRKEIVAGLLVADLTSEQLKAAITNAIGDLDKMMKKYGDNDIIDIFPDKLHYGPSLPAPEFNPDDPNAVKAPKGKVSKLAPNKKGGISKHARGLPAGGKGSRLAGGRKKK